MFTYSFRRNLVSVDETLESINKQREVAEGGRHTESKQRGRRRERERGGRYREDEALQIMVYCVEQKPSCTITTASR